MSKTKYDIVVSIARKYVWISVVMVFVIFLSGMFFDYTEAKRMFTLSMINLGAAIMNNFVLQGFVQEYLPTVKSKRGKVVASVFMFLYILALLLSVLSLAMK